MLVYTGRTLEEYKKNRLQINPDWNQRDFVSLTRKYFQGQTEKILAVSGLRGTGKTVGILQALDELEAAYILVQKGENETGADYVNFLKNTDLRNIAIDEYGWIKDRKCLDGYLLTAVQNDKRIVITGTESITLDYLNYGSLIHRVGVLHTTMFTYDEYRRVYGLEHDPKVCDDYLVRGGLFKDYALTNFPSMQHYVQSAIIDNLAGYMKDEISEEEAKILTYSVLYKAVCPSNLTNVPTLRNNHVTLDNFLDVMGVNTELPVKSHHLHRVSEVFEHAGIIVRVRNIDPDSTVKEQYYITNPSLSCQLIKAAYGLDSVNKDLLGHVFEASAMVQLSANKLSEHELYFANNSGRNSGISKELDIIITDRKREHAYLFECKHKTNSELRDSDIILSGYVEKQYLKGTDIDGRYVIYNGKPCVNEYGVGDIMFTPLDNTVNNYFNFEANIQDIPRVVRYHAESDDKKNIISKVLADGNAMLANEIIEQQAEINGMQV